MSDTQDIPVPQIHASRGTPLVCTSCYTADAETFYLKRRRGLYALLCFRNGEGCWEHSARTLCSHVDEYQYQCQNLAEYEIVSADMKNSRNTCLGHVGFMLSPAVNSQRVYPLDE
jgi:hypothetical protein